MVPFEKIAKSRMQRLALFGIGDKPKQAPAAGTGGDAALNQRMQILRNILKKMQPLQDEYAKAQAQMLAIKSKLKPLEEMKKETEEGLASLGVNVESLYRR